ncbi:MAG TPA: glutathione transferase GstA [Patescibacteria group bacterium]|nr:glutathione transferase GstA [Patescibacteria group bacterium]
MKLYVSAGSCSQAPHIVAREAGIELELVPVDLQSKTYAKGRDYREVSENGYVPALEVAPGVVLTEGPAIMQYLADLNPAAALAPPNGTLPRYQLQQWLNFVTSELHKGFAPLFNPATPAAYREIALSLLRNRHAVIEKALAEHEHVAGAQFSIVDAYLFVVTGWAGYVGLDLAAFPKLQAWRKRVAERPAVRDAMRAEAALTAKAA